MISLEKLKLKNGSVDGIANYLQTTAKYYEQTGMDLPARWITKGSAGDALNDPARDPNDDFARMLAGIDPLTGQTLRKSTTAKTVLAFDVGTSCPKAFSLALATADEPLRGQIAKAMEKANGLALQYVMSELTSRTGQGGKGSTMQVQECFARSVMHLDSREGDPQAHFHNVLINVAIGTDGKARTLDGKKLYALQRSAGAIFDQAVARELQALGFGITRTIEDSDKGTIRWGIVGIDREVEKVFSMRRNQIIEHMERTGENSDTASKKTRKRKDNELTPAQICDNTAKVMAQLKQEGLTHWERAKDLAGARSQIEELDHMKIFQQLHKTESAFDRAQLIEAVAKYEALGFDPEKTADNTIKRCLFDGSVIPLQSTADGTKRFCSREQYELEVKGVVLAQRLHANKKHDLDPKLVDEAIKAQEQELGYGLADEQKNAIRQMCGTGGYGNIQGWAGTGKSASAGAYVKAHHSAGYTVIGSSTSNVATKNLAEEINKNAPDGKKIKALNTTRLLNALDSGETILSDKHLIVLDEAGMIGAETQTRLLSHIEHAGAKVICVGDLNQLQPINAGNNFRYTLDALGGASQQEIKRQRNETHLALAKEFYDAKKTGQQIMDEMRAKNMLVQCKDQGKAVRELVQDYQADPKGHEQKLILATTHDEIAKLTDVLREDMKQKKQLDTEQSKLIGVTTPGKGGKNPESAEKEFCAGDRIRFTKNNSALGVNNNDMATLVRFDHEQKAMIVKLDGKPNEMSVALDPKINHFTHGYARTSHSAQGLGADHVFALGTGSQSFDRNMGLVNFTRTKEQFRMYGTSKQFNSMAEAMDEFRPKEGVLSLLRPEQAEMFRHDVESMHRNINAKNFVKDFNAKLVEKANALENERNSALAFVSSYEDKMEKKATLTETTELKRGKKTAIDGRCKAINEELSKVPFYEKLGKEAREKRKELKILGEEREEVDKSHRQVYQKIEELNGDLKKDKSEYEEKTQALFQLDQEQQQLKNNYQKNVRAEATAKGMNLDRDMNQKPLIEIIREAQAKEEKKKKQQREVEKTMEKLREQELARWAWEQQERAKQELARQQTPTQQHQPTQQIRQRRGRGLSL